jgi:hypothetical protein
VLTLNFNSPDAYSFGAGWGNPGSEFIMLVTPRLAVYTKIGDRGVGRFMFSRNRRQCCSASWSNEPSTGSWRNGLSDGLAVERPREVNRERFLAEQEGWRRWNPEQSRAEAEFHSNKPVSTI